MRALGMTTVFGNPGSTELKFLCEWPSDFRYVMALHEGSAVAMADAYAQLSRNATLVSLHSAGGLGNAMGAVFTAFRNQAPLVIIAGQQTRAMLPREPFLYAADSTTLPRPYVKWSVEPARAADVPAAIARAYHIAMQRPFGPTFVSICEDDWVATSAPVLIRQVRGTFTATDDELAVLTEAINAARSPALVVGAGVDRDDAVASTIALAERLDAPVFASALTSRCSFPEDHRLFAGALPRVRDGVAKALAAHDVVIVLGAPVFNYHIHVDGPRIEEDTTLFLLVDDPSAASNAETGTAIITALGPAIDYLRAHVELRPGRRSAGRRLAAVKNKKGPISIATLLTTLREVIPAGVIITEEAPSTHTVLHDFGLLRPGAYFSAASGSLGYGLPAAVGAALARPGTRVLAIIGDGSSHYAIQALWTAVEQKLPITFAIVNNRGYGAMKQFTQLQNLTGTPSFDLGHVDLVDIARGYGCAARRVEDASELAAGLAESLENDGPMLIDIVIDTTLPTLF